MLSRILLTAARSLTKAMMRMEAWRSGRRPVNYSLLSGAQCLQERIEKIAALVGSQTQVIRSFEFEMGNAADDLHLPPPRRAARKLKVQINMAPLSSTTFANRVCASSRASSWASRPQAFHFSSERQ